MSEALQVLIVEDSENDAELLLLQLVRDGFDPRSRRVETASEMDSALRAQRWDAIISDYSLPSFSAPAALDLLKKSGHDIPFIVVSGTVGEEVAVETMRAGAHDYLPKGKLTRLGEALRREIREAEVRRSERTSVERIEHLNRILRAIRNVNQLIVREKEPKSLIQQACDLLVETHGYRAAWIALVSDGEHVGHLASAGWGDAFEAFAQRVRSRLEPPCWPKACADRQRLVALDPGTECADCPLRGAYAGGNAMVSALVHGGKFLGFMGISTQPGLAINEEERSLVLEASGDLAFALDAIGHEKERREATERFRVSFEKASIGKALTSCDGHFLRVNDAFAKMLGFSSAELEGKALNEVTHPDDRAAGTNPIDALLAGKETTRVEKRLVARSNATVWLDINVALARDFDGQPQYCIVSFVDVTERKAKETELRRAIDDLNRSNKDLERFAYVASHDLQEPLRMVASYTQLLAQKYKDQLDAKAQMYIGYAVDGATRMQVLIDDLLTYSRISTKARPAEPTDSHEVFSEILRNLQVAIEKSGALVTTDDLPTVLVDPVQLLQVLQNLVANAIKFHGAASPRVHISAEDRGDQWLFSVKDNGIGIEAQYASRLFVLFQRLHTRQEYEGTGIGLALCKRIVERHGGRIWFESAAQEGTTFFFTIPKRGKNE